jgi:PAS domain S-box-containing protein
MNIYNESYKTVLLIVDSENNPGQLYSFFADAGYRIFVKSLAEVQGLPQLLIGIRPIITVVDIKSESLTIDIVSLIDSDAENYATPVVIMTDEPERHQREVQDCPFYAVWLARCFSPDTAMASISPYLRIGKTVLESEDMLKGQEKAFRERIRNIEQNAAKLNARIEQITSMNRHIADECVANRANSDILPPFLRLSPEVVAITRIADGKVIDVNDAVERVTGYTREYAMSTTTLREGLWAFSEDRAKMFNILFKEGKIHNFETRFRKKSGAIFPVLFSSAAIVYDNEPCIIAMFIDISERRRAEKLLDARLVLSETSFSNDTELVFARALEQAEKLTDSHISFFHRVSDSGKTLLIQAWSENTMKV